jgi:hypothetical protein
MAESTVPVDFTKKRNSLRAVSIFKMKDIDSLNAKTPEKLIKDFIDKNAVIQTDESTTYADFTDFVDVHLKEISATKKGEFNLKWAHIAAIN